MLNHEVKIHDRKQFEVKLHYPFNKKKSEREYLVETYFFIPNTLGINKYSFHKKNFYDSVKNYIRFATPRLTLDEILNENNSPLNKVFIAVGKNDENFNRNNIDVYEHELKMFCAVFTASVRKEFLKIISGSENDFKDKTKKLLSVIKAIIEKFRKLENKIESKKEYAEIFRFGDEYISLVIEKYFYIILYKYDKNIKEESNSLKNNLLSFIENEIAHRTKKNYKSIIREESSNEEMLFRFSTLKKYFSSVLSIEADIEKEGTFLEQILFGIAAGIAMLFATSVAFWGQSSFGNFTMPFFIVLVVSYMFKDRIKEVLRETLRKKIFKHLYDYKYKLYIDEKYKVGIIRESFDFIKKKKLDKSIWELRQKYRTPEFDNKFQKEKIILYRKKINLKSKFFKKQGEDGLTAITDIFRFDVTRFLNKMDDPRKVLFTLTENGYKKIYGKRVYHINLVLRIIRNKEEELKRFRLVLTKKGIDRIEPVYEGTDGEIV